MVSFSFSFLLILLLLDETLFYHNCSLHNKWVQSLGQEDPPEKEMATHSSVLAWNPRDGGAWWAAVYGVAQSLTLLKQLSS